MHFGFGRDYLEYLEADKDTQLELINDATKDTYVRLQTTEWFNLGTKEGRRDALCQVLGLVKRF